MKTRDVRLDVSQMPPTFCMRVRGNCMEPKIPEGSIVICKRANSAEIGSIVIANIDASETDSGYIAVKSLQQIDGQVGLVPLNPAYARDGLRGRTFEICARVDSILTRVSEEWPRLEGCPT